METPARHAKNYDAIVVGTGPGGATVARELVKKGQHVLMLEWGKDVPFNGSKTQAMGIIGTPGKNYTITSDGMIVGKGTTVGGSTSLYCGSAYPPPIAMFAKYGVDIRAELEETRKDLPIGKLKSELIGPHSKVIAESARLLGHKWELLDKFNYQDKCRLGCFMCFTGCPNGAKWTARGYALEAKSGGATLLTEAKALDIIVENGTATGVKYSHEGSMHSAYAKNIIIAAGGLGTPVLLRKAGIGNAGKNFFVDPMVLAFGLLDALPGGGEVPMTGGMHLPEEGIMMADLPLYPVVYRLLALQKLHVKNAINHKKAVGIMVKAKDDLGGEVTNSGGVKKVLTVNDHKRLATGYELAKGILERAGAKNIFKSMIIAGHPGGTAKIGDIVDSNLMTAAVKNLYVSDCSVIPEAWGLPPTLTLVCLGKRLAKHLQ